MKSGYVMLAERGLIALRGDEARALLQGVISTSIERVTPTSASYGALLTPQGKYLFDFILMQIGDTLLLDTERDRVADLMRRLMLYRMRAKVEIEDQSERLRGRSAGGRRGRTAGTAGASRRRAGAATTAWC